MQVSRRHAWLDHVKLYRQLAFAILSSKSRVIYSFTITSSIASGRPMNPRLLGLLADPNDGGALELHTFEGDEAETRSGVLLNPHTGRWYPIRDGILTLFADALREGDESFTAHFHDAMVAVGCRTEPLSATAVNAARDFERIESERRARDEQAEDYDRMISM